MTPVPSAARPGPPAASATPELGLQAGNWWPAEYDAVVAGWIERTRAAREAAGRKGAVDR